MLEFHATPLVGATLTLLGLICLWWLVVEWGFSKSPAKKRSEKINASSASSALHTSAGRNDQTLKRESLQTDSSQSVIRNTGNSRANSGSGNHTDSSNNQRASSEQSHQSLKNSGTGKSTRSTVKTKNLKTKISDSKSDSSKTVNSNKHHTNNAQHDKSQSKDSNQAATLHRNKQAKTATRNNHQTTSEQPATVKSDKAAKHACHKSGETIDQQKDNNKTSATNNTGRGTNGNKKSDQIDALSTDKCLEATQTSATSAETNRQSNQSFAADSQHANLHTAQPNSNSQQSLNKSKKHTGNTKPRTADLVTQIETSSSVKLSDKTTAASPPPPQKYQTAAKAKRPAAGSEATLQIPATTVAASDNRINQAFLKGQKSAKPFPSQSNAKKAGGASALEPAIPASAPQPTKSTTATVGSAPHASVTATSATPATAGNIHTFSVAANTAEKQQRKTELKSGTCAPIAVKLHQDKSSKNKQSPIEKAVAQKAMTKPATAADLTTHSTARANTVDPAQPQTANPQTEDQSQLEGTATDHTATPCNLITSPSENNTHRTSNNTAQPIAQPDTTETVDGDAALRAKIASGEKHIKILQSTLNNLQDKLPGMTTPVTETPQPHNRPTLLSKVRLLDHPKA